MKALEMGSIEGEEELRQLGAIVSWAFGSGPVESVDWLKRSGIEHGRVVRSGGSVVGGLLEIPMAQWFGGKSVPMLGIAGVAVAPLARGQGVALRLMQHSLREARRRGFLLSALYPALAALYRAVGYELAGEYCAFSMRAVDCPRQSSELDVSLLDAQDLPAVMALYSDVARFRTGYLDRGPYVWSRAQRPFSVDALGVAVRGNAGLEGYAYVVQRKAVDNSLDYDLSLSDLVARTPAALARILSFLADHRSTAGSINWHGGAVDARLFGFPERVFSLSVAKHWMLRLLDAPKALLGRGYPPINAEITLEIVDELLPENNGAHMLKLRDGSASIERTKARQRVRVGPRGLAALYSGFTSAHELSCAGLLEGDAESCSMASAIFAGPTPAMADHF